MSIINYKIGSSRYQFVIKYTLRAVGYIYSMCEQDGDIEECKVCSSYPSFVFTRIS